DARRRLARLGEIDLVQRDELRTQSQAAPVALELGVDGRDVLERIGSRCVDHVNEKPRALDVPQELLAEAETAARPLDEPGDVGDDELAIVEPRDAQIRNERRERIVRDLRSSAGESREERGLSRIRQTGEADVGGELELEVNLPLLALASVGTAPRNVRLASERDDASAAVASPNHQARAIDEHRLKADERPRKRDDSKMRRIRAQAVEHPLHPQSGFRASRAAERALRIGGEIAEDERASGGEIRGQAEQRVE